MTGTVNVGSEFDSLLGDLSKIPKAEYLESAAVGQNRPVPVHEFVESSRFPDQLMAGAQIEMVGVAQYDVCVDVQQVARGHRLNRRLRANGHEDWRVDVAMRRVEHAKARAALLANVLYFKFKIKRRCLFQV